MTNQQLATLNALVTFAAENIPGGLNSEETEVAQIVGRWVLDGVPVRPVCPHCGSVAPYGEERMPWLETHVDSRWHRWWSGVKHKLKI